MERLIPGFMTYLMQVKNASKSTMSSYERDLKRLAAFLDAKGDSYTGGCDSHLFKFLYPFSGTGRFFHSHGFQKCGFHESPFFTISVTRNRRLNDPTSQIRAPAYRPEGTGDPLQWRRWKAFWSSRTRGHAERDPRQSHAGAALCHGHAGDGAHHPEGRRI